MSKYFLSSKLCDSLLECICPCCCEGENHYDIVQLDNEGNALQSLGKISESSGRLARCCCQQNRPLKFKINTDNDKQIEVITESQQKKITIYVLEPCSICTMTPPVCYLIGCPLPCINGCPCLRPKQHVTLENQYIGEVVNPYRICGRTGCICCPEEELDILDENGNMKYMISASCCQSAELCRIFFPLCRCCFAKEFYFKILDATKNEVGMIRNVYNGCWKECCTKEDKFVINFPAGATYKEKILIVNAALLIDFDIFEDTCYRLA